VDGSHLQQVKEAGTISTVLGPKQVVVVGSNPKTWHSAKEQTGVHNKRALIHKSSRKSNTNHRMEQTQTSGYTWGEIRFLGGVSIPTNTDFWIYLRWDQVPGRSKHPQLLGHTRRDPYFQICFEHILLKYSKGLGTSSGNLLVPLPTLFTIWHTIYQTVSCKH
jgi:hypothetical protein